MIIEISNFLLSIVGYEFLISTICFAFVALIVRQAWLRRFDLVFLGLIFCIFPALTPFMTVFSGFEYFTAMNYDLQTNERIVSAMIVIGLMVSGVLLGAAMPQSEKGNIAERNELVFSEPFFVSVLLFNGVLVVLFLEAGTILNSSYADFKLNQEAPYSSLVNQIFNLSVAILFASLPDQSRRRIALGACALLIFYSLIIARRNMSVGLIIIVLYLVGGSRLTMKQLVLGVIAFVALLVIGQARKVGLAAYFSGGGEITSGSIAQLYYSMPGGGANIFLAVIGVIELNVTQHFAGLERMPILLWPSGLNESILYDRSGLAYNGGMHIAAVLYWNFGLLGVFVGGVLLGYFLRYSDRALRRISTPYVGGLAVSVSIYFVLMFSNLMWYGPVGFVKGVIAILLFFSVISFLPRRVIRKTPRYGEN